MKRIQTSKSYAGQVWVHTPRPISSTILSKPNIVYLILGIRNYSTNGMMEFNAMVLMHPDILQGSLESFIINPRKPWIGWKRLV